MDSNIKKNTFWNAVGNIVYLGTQWVVTVMVTRLFGFTDAGVLSLAMSISASFQTVALFGIRNFQVSDIENKYSDTCYVSFRGITCIAAMLLCTLFSVINGYSSDTVVAIILFMIFRLAENYSDVLHGIFQKNDMLYKAGQSLMLKGVVLLVGFTAGYFAFGNMIGSIALMMFAAVLVTVFFDIFQSRRISGYRFTYPISDCYPLAKETIPLCIYMFFNSAIAAAPKYILEKMCDEATLGAYSSIFAPALLIQAAATYIYMPFISRFAEAYQTRCMKVFRTLAVRIMVLIAVIGAVVLIAADFVGEWGLTFIFGEDIVPYSELLTLIIVGTFCTAINAFIQMLAVVVREFKWLVISCAVGVAVCCAASYVGIGLWQADGASIGLIAGNVSGTLIILAVLIEKLNVGGAKE